MSHQRIMRSHLSRGFGLLDTLVACFLMLVIFVGIAGAFQLSIDVVGNNKARAGAIALANERMEYLRSLTYSALGTVGGIPAGLIPQSETVNINGVPFTRRTFIDYEDDPKDGTGVADANGIVEDYKQVKVDVSWVSRNGTRHIITSSRFSPPGIETAVPGGTLVINEVTAVGTPLSGAQVVIVNGSTTPAINVTTFTNASGTADFLGVPAASNYQVTVSKTGYSAAQTYSVTAQNTNPSPANLTIANNLTTTGTFAIDLLGTLNIYTWSPIQAGTWTDMYADSTKVATTTNVTVSGGVAAISGSAPFTSGSFQTIAIGPSAIAKWKTFAATEAKPSGTSITYKVYDGAGAVLVPDGQIPGNSTGLTNPFSLSGVATSTYTALRIVATLTGTSTSTPSVDAVNIGYDYGPVALPNIAFTLRGAKTTGSGPSGTQYKYSNASLTSGASGVVTIPNLEWDSYLMTVAGTSTGYDISSSCTVPQPQSLAPGATLSENIYLLTHTTNSLLVSVHSSATGLAVSGATVVLSKAGFTTTVTTDNCGQVYIGSLVSSNTYTATVGAPGYATSTTANVVVGGTSNLSVTLN